MQLKEILRAGETYEPRAQATSVDPSEIVQDGASLWRSKNLLGIEFGGRVATDCRKDMLATDG